MLHRVLFPKILVAYKTLSATITSYSPPQALVRLSLLQRRALNFICARNGANSYQVLSANAGDNYVGEVVEVTV